MSFSFRPSLEPIFGPTGWPAAGHKLAVWTPDDSLLHSRLRLSPAGEYLQCVPARLADLDWPLNSHLAAFAEGAAIEATKFDARLNSSIWSYDIVLLRSEAAASSQIEQLSASPRAIIEAELGDRSRPNATLIAANTRALHNAISQAQNLSVQTILDLHAVLMDGQTYLTPGQLRRGAVWIGGRSPVDAKFVGPDPVDLEAHLQDLVEYCNRTDIPVLIQTAIAHAQFETIHPFDDGNGRVGRALIHLMLRNTGITAQSVLPISGALLTRSQAYYSALDQYRQGQPELIIELFAHSFLDAVENGRWLMANIAAVEKEWQQTLNLRSDSGVWRLLKYALRQPVFTADSALKDIEQTKVNFYRNAETLVEAGILVRSKFGKSQDSWRAPQVLEAMQEFANRSGFRDY